MSKVHERLRANRQAAAPPSPLTEARREREAATRENTDALGQCAEGRLKRYESLEERARSKRELLIEGIRGLEERARSLELELDAAKLALEEEQQRSRAVSEQAALREEELQAQIDELREEVDTLMSGGAHGAPVPPMEREREGDAARPSLLSLAKGRLRK